MKLNIAVLYGHLSCEHDISIITALQAIRNLDLEKYNVIPIYVTKENKYIMSKKLTDISIYNKQVKGREVCFLPNSKFLYLKFKNNLIKYKYINVALFCFHGRMGEDGKMQGLFELNDIPYTSTGVLGSVLGSNKIVFKKLLNSIKVPVIKVISVLHNDYAINSNKKILEIEKKIGYPLIIKPNTLGSSIGISVAKNKNELVKALDLGFEFDEKIIIEKFIENFSEINVASFFNGEKYIFSSLQKIEKENDFLTFENKYLNQNKTKNNLIYRNGNSQNYVNETINKKIISICKRVCDLIDLKGICRFDFILTKDEIYLNEINTIPGNLSNYLFKDLGYNYKKLLNELINSAILNNSKKKEYTHSFSSSVLNGVNFGVKK